MLSSTTRYRRTSRISTLSLERSLDHFEISPLSEDQKGFLIGSIAAGGDGVVGTGSPTALRRPRLSKTKSSASVKIGLTVDLTPKPEANTRFAKLFAVVQLFYEKSRFHYAIPILVLVAYSLLGGLLFYSIEGPNERQLLAEKKAYIEKEQGKLLLHVYQVDQRIRALHHFYNSSRIRNVHISKYRKFALNSINKAVYWYVLGIYYLTDHESYKSSILHPDNPEPLWRSHFATNFGRIFALKNYTQQLSLRCWEIGLEMNSPSLASKKLNDSLKMFDKWTGLDHVLVPTWTFWNSVFLAVTTYTTIGYGNISAKSMLGRLAVMIYAIVGIPLVLMILHKLGRYLLLGLQYVWGWVIWLMEQISCVKNAEKFRPKFSVDVDTREPPGGMPLVLAIGVAFGWMFLCAAIFLRFEREWDYFKSFYFVFCSLTTIGFGDVTPTNSEDLHIIFYFIVIGLSLVSMCINVLQLKLEELFEEFMLDAMAQSGMEPLGDMKRRIVFYSLIHIYQHYNCLQIGRRILLLRRIGSLGSRSRKISQLRSPVG
ncbi:hypothetical protein QR680_003040 [Steinernema hermaphroditum]|uniref:Potassium channel domain-containing protein n=1 Tax=Steinernema hermaphroditum TaxID=289476 RepID=A0AA39LJE4_9BILA|nr:hypothetical protein QR680_003040 [Steinernema hermaphroditum]